MSLARAGAVGMGVALILKKEHEKKSPYDYFSGSYSYYWNDLIKFFKLNLTILMAPDYGSCYSNGTCDGVTQMLAKGEVDFSLMPIGPLFGPDVLVTSDSPFIRGPVNSFISITIQSVPRVKETKSKLDILQAYREMPISVVVYSALFILAVLLLCKVPLRKLGKKFKLQRRKYKLSVFSFVDVFFNSSTVPLPPFVHLFFIYLSTIFFVTVLKNAISSSVNSDVIKVEPAKYYETLNEFVTAAEKKKITLYHVRGLRAISEVSMRKEPIYRRVVRVSTPEDRTSVIKLVGTMTTGLSAVMDTHINAHWAQAATCFSNREMAGRLKLMTPPISESILVLGLSKNISSPLKKLLAKTYRILFESGLSQEYDRKRNLFSVLDIFGNYLHSSLIHCYATLGAVKSGTSKLESMANPLDLAKAGIIFEILLSIGLIALAIEGFEYFWVTRPRTRLKGDSYKLPVTNRRRRIRFYFEYV